MNDEATLAVPILYGLDNVPIGGQRRAIRGNVVDRPLHLIENENRRPAMVVRRLFLVRAQGHFEHAQPLVLEDDLVVCRRRNDGVELRIPLRRVRMVDRGGHGRISTGGTTGWIAPCRERCCPSRSEEHTSELQS